MLELKFYVPYGGVSYIARLFGWEQSTILRAIKELQFEETLGQNRDRQAGGGRKPELEKPPDIDEVFLNILKEHTAGFPLDEKVPFPNLGHGEIRNLLREQGIKVSRHIVKKLLKKHGYVSLQALKKKACNETKNRNAKGRKSC